MGKRAEGAPIHCAGVLATACTQGRRWQHGKPDSVVGRDDQPEAGDGQRGRYGVAERPVVLRSRVMLVEGRGLGSRRVLKVGSTGDWGNPMKLR